ncbi:MAG: glycosyltransferase family 4 protein [Chloroflexota bacterium]|nr:glycosyltransferase family 4 protein [Chloroflexota bacterium]
MTRVLVVLKYAPPGSPQDQQRGQVYGPSFRAAGIDVRYVARYPMWAMGRAQTLTRSAQPLSSGPRSRLTSRVRRVFDTVNDRRILAAARESDIVFVVKADSPELLRALRETTRARLVYDLADVRVGDPRESAAMAEMLRDVDAITVDNPVALEYARSFGKPVHLFPPLAYVERSAELRASSRRGRDDRVVIGWIGTPSTTSNLYQVIEALEDVSRAHPAVELRLLGVPAGHELVGRFEHVRVTCRSTYDSETMIREVLDMDVGLFPQYDLQQAAMHGVTKALIYMGGGAAVVASPVGEVARLIRDSDNGLLAVGRSDWAAKIGGLVADPALRARLAEAGLRSVRDTNSIERCFAHLRDALGA